MEIKENSEAFIQFIKEKEKFWQNHIGKRVRFFVKNKREGAKDLIRQGRILYAEAGYLGVFDEVVQQELGEPIERVCDHKILPDEEGGMYE